MTVFPLLMIAVVGTIFFVGNNTNQDTQAVAVLTIPPTQPGAIAYNTASSACAYARSGGMVLAGRDNYADNCFKQVSASGGHVLIYIDALLHNTSGRYHALLYNASECGGAVPKWPGNLSYNGYGTAADFRVGGVLQGKLECVLEKMVAENPHMAGFFADDLGGSNGPDQNSAFNREEWYQGAVALSKTYRKVADRHGILFMVNGMWQGGSSNAGYPNRSQTGNALADGVCVEHHPVIEGSFNWPNSVLKASQWADQSTVTNGTPTHFVIAFAGSQFDGWRNYTDTGAAWLTAQAGDGGYSAAPAPWGGGHATGLPTKVGGSTSSNPTPPPPQPPTPPTPNIPPSTPSTQSPYTSAITIPGRLESENYDKGGQGIAYNDTTTANQGGKYRADGVDIEDSTEGGYSIGWVSSGEWLEYTTNVTQAGKYNLTFRVASAMSGTWQLKDGNTVLATATTTNTGGWYSWKDVTINDVNLTAGTRILRLEASGDPVNLNYVQFTKQSTGTTPTPTPNPTPSTPTIPTTPRPPISVPGANTSTPVAIPVGLPVEGDGSLVADFNGDGLNEIARDSNGDGFIDPTNEIVVEGTDNMELTDTSSAPITVRDIKKKSDSNSFTINAGPISNVKIAKPAVYTFAVAQGLIITGLGAYLAVTKLAMFAGLRGRLGL